MYVSSWNTSKVRNTLLTDMHYRLVCEKMSNPQVHIKKRKVWKSLKRWETIGGTRTRTTMVINKQRLNQQPIIQQSVLVADDQINDMDKILAKNYGIIADDETERFFDDLYRQYFQDFFRQLVLDYVRNR